VQIFLLIALLLLLIWIFSRYSKLAKERNKSIVLIGIIGTGSLLLGTYLGGLIEIALFGFKQGLLASFIGFGSCFILYHFLKGKKPIA
jgi:small-conductance mechanosensitive channel